MALPPGYAVETFGFESLAASLTGVEAPFGLVSERLLGCMLHRAATCKGGRHAVLSPLLSSRLRLNNCAVFLLQSSLLLS